MRVDYFDDFEKGYVTVNERYTQTKDELCNYHYDKMINSFRYRESVTTEGIIGFMCPHCFNVFYARINNLASVEIDTKENLVVDIFQRTEYSVNECPSCGEYADLITLDPNLAKTISILNKKRYLTKFCCEGHEGIDEHGYIYFQDRSIEDYLHTLPISWYLDTEPIVQFILTDNPEDGYVIRCDVFNKAEAMYDIRKWANSLPSRSLTTKSLIRLDDMRR